MGSEGGSGELASVVDLPAAARAGQVYSLPTILGLLDTSQQFASPAGVDIPGTTELVHRTPASSSGGAAVRGAQSSAGGVGGEGEVAGYYSFDRNAFNLTGPEQLYWLLYINKKQPTSPAANIVAGHLEDGALHTLDAITKGAFGEKHGANHRDAFRPAPGGGLFH